MRFRVLHVVTRLDLGGAQENTLYSVAHHDRRRFDVELLAGRGGLLDTEARETARARLVDYLVHPIAPLRDPLAVVRLAAEIRRGRFDLVHTHCSKAGILGRLAARLARVPVIVHTVHGWSFNDTQGAPARALYAGLERAAARITDRLIVVSASDRGKGLASRIGRPEQYELLRSGIDIRRFERPATPREAVRAAMGFEPGHVVVGTLACLKHQKAPLDFVEAARRAHLRRDDLRFFIAGDGDLRPAVEERIRSGGLEGVVTLLGWRRDAAELLHAMDLFLLTSRFEGLPRAVLQAMAAGVPVVATAVDGVPEVVRHAETGVLVPPGDPGAAAERLLELAAEPRRGASLARAARERLGSEYDIEGMVRRLDRLYLRLLEAEPAGAGMEVDADGRV